MATRKNAVNLYIIQGTNILIPLLALPYLGRALGPQGFGAIAFAQLLLQYIVLMADFGFNLTATRRISMVRDDPHQISSIVVNTTMVRVLLALLGVLIVTALVHWVPGFQSNSHIVFISFAAVLGTVMTPAWLFHGLERNGVLAIITTVPRIITLVPLALMVKTTSDLELAAWLQFVPQLMTGLLCLLWMCIFSPLTLAKPSNENIKFAFKDGFHVFSASILTSIYVYINGIIIKLLGGEAALGLYAAAEKLVKAIGAMVNPAIQAVYPRVCAGNDAPLPKLYAIVIFLTAGCWAGSLLLGHWVITLIFGARFTEAASVLQILALGPVFAGLGSVSVQLKILAWGEHRRLKSIYAISVAFHAIQAPLLVWMWGVHGAATSVVLTEALTFLCIRHVTKQIETERRQQS